MAAHSPHVKLLVFAAALGCLLSIAHFSPAVHANGDLYGGDAASAAATPDDSGQPIVAARSSSPSADDVSLPSPEHLPSLFLAWLERHPRAYHAVEAPARHMEEKLHRFAIFADNVRHIFEHNKHRHGSGKASYWLDLNEFADLTHEEFKQKYLQSSSSGKQLMRRTVYLAQPTVTHVASDAGQCLSSAAVASDVDSLNSGCAYGAGNDVGIAIPASVDWRERGAVTPVKNQGQCGSCWAFSTVVAVEGAHQIATGELVSLSEQELVDCDTDTNSGCNGGAMPAAFEFLVNNGGIDTEEDYPYKARKGACVASKRDNRMVTIDSYEEVPINDEQALLRAVASQPVSVGIDASTRDFQFYAGGVYDGNCGTDLDHGVAIVGYGTTDDDSRQDYWIVKNSWGPNWGDDGFILMKRGTLQPEGKCGINTMASFPIKKDTEAHKSPQSHHRHKHH